MSAVRLVRFSEAYSRRWSVFAVVRCRAFATTGSRVEATGTFLSPHEILGVRLGADEAEIKTAYRKQALRCHPDVLAAKIGSGTNPGAAESERKAAEETFRNLKAAYSELLGRRGRTGLQVEASELTVGMIVRLKSSENEFKQAFARSGHHYHWDDTMRDILGTEQTIVDFAETDVFGLRECVPNSGQPVWYYPISVIAEVQAGTAGFDRTSWPISRKPRAPPYLQVAMALSLPLGVLIYDLFFGTMAMMREEQALLAAGGWACPHCTLVNRKGSLSCPCGLSHEDRHDAHVTSAAAKDAREACVAAFKRGNADAQRSLQSEQVEAS